MRVKSPLVRGGNRGSGLAAGAQPRRQRLTEQHRRAAPEKGVTAVLVLGERPAGRTGREMRLDAAPLLRRELPIDVGGETSGDPATVVHAVDDTGTFPGPSDLIRFTAFRSMRRPREMRDITVPIGISSMRAISAYENSSTSRIQTA